MAKSENVIWHQHKVSSSDREKAMGQRGLVLWFTGLSGSGKSTIAAEVESELSRLGFRSYLLDGDNVRHGLCGNLGFSDADRDENIRRIYEAASLFCDAGFITLVSAISPFAAMREAARAKINSQNNDSFSEIYVKTSLETCIKRDTKGLYKKALAGEIKNFTGIDSPYEEPQSPELVFDTDDTSAGDAVFTVIQHIFDKQLPFLYAKILRDSIDAEIFAGKKILDVYSRDFAVEYKDDKSPLTEADKKSNDIIYSSLKKYAPYISFLSEEQKDDKSRLSNRFCFVVDPLDGTKEFVKKNGEFTVNIGLSRCGKPVLGVILIPCTSELYYSADSLGAYYVNLGEKQLYFLDSDDRISVSGRTSELVVMKSRSHGDDTLEAMLEGHRGRIKSEVMSGSSIKGCMIAKGEADIYYRFGYTSEWDTCAMQSVVEEAGGIMVQGDGSDLTYNRANSLNEKGFYILNSIENKLN